MQKLYKSALATCALAISANASAALITENFIVTAQTGIFSGTVGTGFIIYDDLLIDGAGAEELIGSNFSITVTVFGQTFTGADDIAYPSTFFPRLLFQSGGITGVDFVVSEHYLADTVPENSQLIEINQAGVYDFSIQELTAVNGGGFAGELFINENEVPAPAVPVPAAVWLFGSGLLGLIGMGRRKAA